MSTGIPNNRGMSRIPVPGLQLQSGGGFPHSLTPEPNKINIQWSKGELSQIKMQIHLPANSEKNPQTPNIAQGQHRTSTVPFPLTSAVPKTLYVEQLKNTVSFLSHAPGEKPHSQSLTGKIPKPRNGPSVEAWTSSIADDSTPRDKSQQTRKNNDSSIPQVPMDNRSSTIFLSPDLSFAKSNIVKPQFTSKLPAFGLTPISKQNSQAQPEFGTSATPLQYPTIVKNPRVEQLKNSEPSFLPSKAEKPHKKIPKSSMQLSSETLTSTIPPSQSVILEKPRGSTMGANVRLQHETSEDPPPSLSAGLKNPRVELFKIMEEMLPHTKGKKPQSRIAKNISKSNKKALSKPTTNNRSPSPLRDNLETLKNSQCAVSQVLPDSRAVIDTSTIPTTLYNQSNTSRSVKPKPQEAQATSKLPGYRSIPIPEQNSQIPGVQPQYGTSAALIPSSSADLETPLVDPLINVETPLSRARGQKAHTRSFALLRKKLAQSAWTYATSPSPPRDNPETLKNNESASVQLPVDSRAAIDTSSTADSSVPSKEANTASVKAQPQTQIYKLPALAFRLPTNSEQNLQAQLNHGTSAAPLSSKVAVLKNPRVEKLKNAEPSLPKPKEQKPQSRSLAQIDKTISKSCNELSTESCSCCATTFPAQLPLVSKPSINTAIDAAAKPYSQSNTRTRSAKPKPDAPAISKLQIPATPLPRSFQHQCKPGEIQCGQKSKSTEDLSNNVVKKISRPKRKDFEFGCPFCSLLNSRKAVIDRHVLEFHHVASPAIYCDDCGRGFFVASVLPEHPKFKTIVLVSVLDHKT